MTHILVEFECQTEGCKFVTLSLTTAYQHIQDTLDFKGRPPEAVNHNVEPRAYLKSDPINMTSTPPVEPEPPSLLDPEPWLFVSDQVVGEHRSAVDRGYNRVADTYWIFLPRVGYERDREKYPLHVRRGLGSDVPRGEPGE